jgi:signal transduction histidine kinase
MYYSEPRSPSDAELVFTHTATLLAANIIVRAQAEASLHERTVAAEDAAAALVQSEASMRRARAQAEHANQSKADFLAMVSHELRTPLNAIGGYAQLMLDGIPDAATENQQNYLHRILSGQRHILSLIDSVLTHAKLEAGSMSYRMADVRMRDMLDLIEGLLTPQFADKNLSYDCSECDAGIALRGDSEKIAQILLNVVSNAIKFTPPGGSVSISTAAAANNHTRVIVRDTGIGMSASELSIVFEPFVQFDNQLTNRERGTGLGMPISRGLARGMGGDLTATSEPGAGTAFTLTLETAGARIA